MTENNNRNRVRVGVKILETKEKLAMWEKWRTEPRFANVTDQIDEDIADLKAKLKKLERLN